VLVDADGRIVHKDVSGALTTPALRELVRRHLGIGT
jgi:hypothetical protein